MTKGEASMAQEGARPVCPLTTDNLDTIIQLDASSERKSHARTGERYFDGENDILKHRIFYFDGDGVLVEDKFSSNIRTAHGFFSELVTQKVDYLVSPGERHVTSDDAKLDGLVAPYFDDEFNAALVECCTDASKNGFGYLYSYVNQDGAARFDHADSLGVIEVHRGSTASDCDFVIYRYLDHVDYGRKKIERIVVWDTEWTWYFVRDDESGITIDKSALPDNPRPHKQWTDDTEEGTFYSGFGFIPFWRLDNNRKQFTDLKPIKGIIDDYDLMKCGLSNSLEDLSEGFYVVKGYQGTNGDLTELITNLRRKKHIGVSEEGGVEVQTVQIPYEARRANMEIDKENIYRFGMGFDTSSLKDSSATTNIAIKAAYALLDLKCNRFETRLKALMKRLVSFVLDEINEREGTAYGLADVRIEFQREVMTNATDNAQIALTEAQTKQTEVGTLLNEASVYGDEAVLESVCGLLDLDPEEVRDISPGFGDGGLDDAVATLTGNE